MKLESSHYLEERCKFKGQKENQTGNKRKKCEMVEITTGKIREIEGYNHWYIIKKRKKGKWCNKKVNDYLGLGWRGRFKGEG